MLANVEKFPPNFAEKVEKCAGGLKFRYIDHDRDGLLSTSARIDITIDLSIDIEVCFRSDC